MTHLAKIESTGLAIHMHETPAQNIEIPFLVFPQFFINVRCGAENYGVSESANKRVKLGKT